jgi:CRISPR-associated protein Csx10
MKAITYSLYLEEPLLATQPASGEPNSATSYDFIPGSTIRGALVKAFLRDRQDKIDDMARDHLVRALFFDGNVRFLNAYPRSLDQPLQRMLPTPKSWFVEKGDSGNFAERAVNFSAPGARDLENPQASQGSYCHISETAATLLSPAMKITVHNASQEPGIKEAGNSQVFRYEALAPDQVFSGAIVCADEDEAYLEQIGEILANELYLGGSSNAGYGYVSVQDVLMEPDWQEYEPGPSNGKTIAITLLSDAIVRTEAGANSVDISHLIDPNLEPLDTYVGSRVVGGFNRKWGLPLAQSLAIEQGSVFVYTADQIPDAMLQKLIQSGIGERTVEGFGRIAVNWHPAAEYSRREAEPQPSYDILTLKSGESKRIAQRILNRHREERLEDGLAAHLNVKTLHFRKLPSKTQLARLRVAVQNALMAGDLSGIKDHLDNLKGAKRYWDKALLNEESLSGWIKQQCDLKTDEIEAEFLLVRDFSELGGLQAAVPDEVKLSILARYIDGILKLAIEEQKRLEGGVTNG